MNADAKSWEPARTVRCAVLTLLLLTVSWVAVPAEDARDPRPGGRSQSPSEGPDVLEKSEADDSLSAQRNLKMALACAMKGRVEELTRLLAADPGVATRRVKEDESTALHWAANYHQVEVATLLIKHGADVSAEDNIYRHTPLHTAAGSDALDVVKVLIAAGADVNCLAEGPLKTVTSPLLPLTPYASPLDVAAERGAEHVVQFLLTKDAKLDVNPPKSTYSALHRAMFGNYDRRGLGNPKRRDDPTAKAAPGNRKVIEMLLAHQADLTAKDWLGNTPFHIGVLRHAPDSVEYLLDHHADQIDVNAPGQFGYTPLQLAVCPRGQPQAEQEVGSVIKLLRKHGASVTLVGGPATPPETPLEYARKRKWGNDILDLLRP